MKDHKLAEYELNSWIKKAKACGLNPMSKLADKIERHRILNSIEHQANSAKSESTNTTIKYLIKLARGFRTLENMFALIYLKCSDIIIPLCNLYISFEYNLKIKDSQNIKSHFAYCFQKYRYCRRIPNNNLTKFLVRKS
ncbi:MAG: transposase [Oscillospiraceae bacterium]|nr:transposase [Oscillospiraceae bacterium]